MATNYGLLCWTNFWCSLLFSQEYSGLPKQEMNVMWLWTFMLFLQIRKTQIILFLKPKSLHTFLRHKTIFHSFHIHLATALSYNSVVLLSRVCFNLEGLMVLVRYYTIGLMSIKCLTLNGLTNKTSLSLEEDRQH